MAYTISSPSLGRPKIDAVDETAIVPVGTVVQGVDPTYGAGEFVYLKGVTSTVVGSMLTYAPSTYQTALSPNTANLGQPVAIAMAATTTAAKYHWGQIGGVAVVKKTAVAVSPNVTLHQSATTGRVMATSASGKQILGARSANVASVTSTTSTVLVSLNRPHMQGRVT